jgi:spore coat polysaccharide biosynthesis predicted glycosyltransferase SpsG
VLHAAGGPAIGVGHLRRTLTLAQAVAAIDASIELVLLWEADEALARTLRGPGAPGQLHLAATPTEGLVRRDLLGRLPGATALVSDILRPSDDYFAGARAAGYAMVAHMNDSGGTRSAADLLVDEGPDAAPPPGHDGRFLGGTRFRMIAAELTALRGSSPWNGPQAARVAIALGGADPGRLSARLLAGVRDHPRFAAIQVEVQVGPAFAAAGVAELERLASGAGNVILSPPSGFAGHLLARADLVVTLGGITAYEAMCLGRAGAAVRHPGMTPYVRALAAEGLLADLGEPDAAASALMDLADDRTRLAALAARGHRAIDGHGARRVAEALLSVR